MLSVWFILLGTLIMVGVLFMPYHWFLRDGGYSKVDKGQAAGVVMIIVGVAWEVGNVLRFS